MITDIVIVGASLGGVMAAHQACLQFGIGNVGSPGHSGSSSDVPPRVVLTAEFDWLGGQMTSQGVPPDEHRLIESGGASESYLNFRRAIRAMYLQNPEFRDRTALTEGCNPGDGWVSRLCFEPRLAAEYFEQMLASHVAAGRLLILRHTKLVSVKKTGRNIVSVQVQDADGVESEISAHYFLDATDTGELIHHAKLDYRIGKEARHEFNEPDAPLTANRLDQQPVTYVMALRKNIDQSSANKTIRKTLKTTTKTAAIASDNYLFWKNYILPHYQYPLFSNLIPGNTKRALSGEIKTGADYSSIELPFFCDVASDKITLDLWRYRRIVSAQNWVSDRAEVSLINWAQNDYGLHPLLDGKSGEDDVVAAAKNLSHCFLYWLQHDAPRVGSVGGGSGMTGYPELQLATDMLGTSDGFAQQVYVRESRRIVGLQCLSETDIAVEDATMLPTQIDNSVGIAWYNMDIHPTCVSGHGVNAKVRPFCLPLGIFITSDCDNLIPACKNTSVTHLVNAATRVHPAEWLIGEVAGMLAHFAMVNNTSLNNIYADQRMVKKFQQQLRANGVPTEWPTVLVQQLNASANNANTANTANH